uniref:Domain of unknown function DB domain-containing protein n=1 Tax=Plectus sambesii TaxID=2011161 RepID=A0A914UYH6_9BILA
MRSTCLLPILSNVRATDMTIPSIFLIATLISSLIGNVAGQMDVDRSSSTRTEPGYCYKLAFFCDSPNGRFREIARRKCPLSCEANLRASICCRNMGVRTECQPLCGYDHKTAENFIDHGLSCADELPMIMSCVARDQDVRRCCMHSAVNYDSPCMNMCYRGATLPSCSFRDVISLEQCLIEEIPRVLRCFLNNMTDVEPLVRTRRFRRHLCPGQMADLKKLLGADQINAIDFFRTVRARR